MKWRVEGKLVIKTLPEGAGEMFLWVYCQPESLCHCLSQNVRGTLYTSPTTLCETYHILRETFKQNANDPYRLLHCPTCSRFGGVRGGPCSCFPSLGDSEAQCGLALGAPRAAVLLACSSLVTAIGDSGSCLALSSSPRTCAYDYGPSLP